MAMRRRVKRDLTLIAGVVLVLAIVIVLNYSSGVAKLAAKFEAIRTEIEEKQVAQGTELLSWKLMRATKGSLSAGGQFDPALLAKDGQNVNLIAFMVPFEQFNHMTEFLILPLPIECYFCQIPPARDIIYVKMKEGTNTKLFEEPVLLSGTLKIHQEAGTKFFYSLDNASLSPAEAGKKLTPKKLKEEHTVPKHEATGNLDPGFDPYAPKN